MLLPLFDFVNSALRGPCCCKLYTCALNSCEQLVRAPGNRIAELGGAECRQRVRQGKGEFLSYFQDKSSHGQCRTSLWWLQVFIIFTTTTTTIMTAIFCLIFSWNILLQHVAKLTSPLRLLSKPPRVWLPDNSYHYQRLSFALSVFLFFLFFCVSLLFVLPHSFVPGEVQLRLWGKFYLGSPWSAFWGFFLNFIYFIRQIDSW